MFSRFQPAHFAFCCFCYASTSLLALTSQCTAAPQQSSITVVGEAQVSAPPDFVIISATITTVDSEVPGVQAKNNETTEAIKKFLREQRLRPEQVTTSLLSIYPIRNSTAVYSDKGGRYLQQSSANENPFGDPDDVPQQNSNRQGESTNKVVYRAQRDLEIKLTEIDRFEAVYCGLLARGIQDSPRVILKNNNPQVHLEKVRIEAVKNARSKAETMAGALNASLTAVNTMVDNESSSSRSMHDPFDPPTEDNAAVGRVIYHSKVEIVFKLSEAVLSK